MYSKMRSFLIITITGLLVISCASSMNPNIERGTDYRFQDGLPEMRITTLGLLGEDDIPYIHVTSEVVRSTLVYHTVDDQSQAEVSFEIRVNKKNGEFRKTFRDTITIDKTSSQPHPDPELLTYVENLEVIPGSFDIAISLTDTKSGKTTHRETTAVIPDPESPEINLTTVRLSGKDLDHPGNEYISVTSYDLPSRTDSLKFEFQVTNNKLEEPLTVNTTLLYYDSDTEPPRPLYGRNHSPSSLKYKGIDVRNHREIDSNTRVLQQSGSVFMEFTYPLLDKGNYRFEVELEDKDGKTLYKARDFAVKSSNYPMVKSPKDLAAPLYYLMDKKEYEQLMALDDPEEIKESVDRFWITAIGNETNARSVMELFYDRVEQANKQFSNFKEGWKTDMGMIYILFGPPMYVDRSLQKMQWSYTYDRYDPRYSFYFEKYWVKNQHYPFHHYLIERDKNYFNVEYKQRQLWLSGSILDHYI